MKKLFWWTKLFIKKTLSILNGKNYRKKRLMKPHYMTIVQYLRTTYGEGSKIKPVFVDTWKYYGFDHVRFSILLKHNSKKYVVKVVKGWDNKTKNGIKIFDVYHDLFDFVPRGQMLEYLDYIININEFINSFTFDKIRLYCNSKQLNNILHEICRILDKLNEYKVVHCDIDNTNILIQKKTFKVFMVDFDTCNSSILDLHDDLFPRFAIRQQFDDYDLYDDAYAIKQLVDRITFINVKTLPEYKGLINRVGRNTYVVNK